MPVNYSRRIQQDTRFRFWISLFAFIVCLLFAFQAAPARLLWVTLLFVLYSAAYTAGYLASLRWTVHPAVQYTLIAIDCLAITLGIALSGGFQSPLFILYIVLFGFCLYHESLSNFVYAVVLSFILYSGLIFLENPFGSKTGYALAGQILLMGVVTGALALVLTRLVRQKKANDQHVSRSKTMAAIADVLSSSLANPRDRIKTVSRLIEEEVEKDGLKCRIVIQKGNQSYLPPSSGKTGVQIPIMVGESLFGVMMVTRESKAPLKASERDFFSSIARSLGLSLHRTRLWDDLQSQMKKVEAKMILGSSAPPAKPPKMDSDLQSVDDMIDLVEMERGRWRLKKQTCSIDQIILEAIQMVTEATTWDAALKPRVVSPIHPVPLFTADFEKLKKLVANMIENAHTMNPKAHGVDIYLSHDNNTLTVTVQTKGKDGVVGQRGEFRTQMGIETNAALVVCKKIAEEHKGQFWIETKEPKGETRYKFTMPLEPVAAAHS